MSQYALDINNPFIKQAMEEQGISSDELIKKQFQNRTKEDFREPGASDQIIQLRYEYYLKKLQKLITNIREEARLIKNRDQAQTSRSPAFNNSLNLSHHISHQSMEDNQFDKLRVLTKQKLLHVLKNHQTARSLSTNKTRNRKNTPDNIASSLGRVEKQSDRHRNKVEQIKQKEIQNHKQLARKIAQNIKEHKEREQKLAIERKQAAKQREKQYKKRQEKVFQAMQQQQEEMEVNIQNKLSNYEEKMKRSAQLYEQTLKTISNKKQADKAKFIAITKQIEQDKETSEINKIKALLDKNSSIRNRQQEIEQKRNMNFELKRNAQEQRLQKAAEQIKKSKIEQRQKAHLIEQKHKAVNHTILKKQKALNQEIEMKRELQKLKEEENVAKIERQRRIFDRKRMQLLEKQLKDAERIQSLKQARQEFATKRRDLQIKAMIEKEKIAEAIAYINKQPNSKAANDMVKKLKTSKSKSLDITS